MPRTDPRPARFATQATLATLATLALLATCLATPQTAPAATPPEPAVTIFAAASLAAPLAKINEAWAAQGHPRLVIALDSSGTLAKQIQQGAPAQIFIAADLKWMDVLDHANLLTPHTRINLLANTLVLIAPISAPTPTSPTAPTKPLTLTPTPTTTRTLTDLLGPTGRLAVGDPAHVPAGIYAQQALTTLGAWPTLKDRLAPAQNVKAALLLVETGQSPAGIVYATDARSDPKVTILATFPQSTHLPITYPAALIGPHPTPQARSALTYLRSLPTQKIFTQAGFTQPR